MKVSKLFHWLYASVMLLPIFAIGVTCGYVIFNKNAYQSYSTSETEYRYSKITASTQFVEGKNYFVNLEEFNNYYNSISNDVYSPIIYFSYIDFNINSYLNTDTTISAFRLSKGTSSNFYFTGFDSFGTQVASKIVYSGGNWISNAIKSFNFTFLSVNAIGSNVLNNAFNEIIEIKAPLNNVFYYAVYHINEMELFNWASDSFIVAPFRYIGNLFGLDNNSPIYTLLSYWTNVSVIWLVFDLIMYVPLLAHRWLDKGGIE